MKVKVILLTDIKGVGKKDQIVEVKEGYAYNFLLNTKKGILATTENINKLNAKKEKLTRNEEKEIEKANEYKKIIESQEIKVGIKEKDGKIFGSIGTKEIADLLKEKYNIEISDRKKISMNETKLKTLGDHKVEIKLFKDIKAILRICLVGEK